MSSHRTLGQLQWMTVAILAASPAANAQQELFAADLEIGSGLTKDVGGQWDWVATYTAATLEVSAASAHRGQSGLRLIDSDPSTAGAQARADFRPSVPLSGTVYIRFWFRAAEALSPGSVTPLLTASETVGQSVLDLEVDLPSGVLWVFGYSTAGTLLEPATTRITLGRWHLIEVEVSGLDTPQGGRRLWVDGQLAYERLGLDLTGWRLTSAGFGEPWSGDGTFTGTLDFDDVRIGRTRPASRIEVGELSAPQMGCKELSVRLQTSDGLAATAPFDLDATWAGSSGELFEAANCAGSSLSRISLVAGAESFGPLFLRTAATGDARFEHPDFLSESLSVDRPVPLDLSVAQGCSHFPAPLTLPWLALCLVWVFAAPKLRATSTRRR
jgi:hypothetical protein